MMSQQGRISCRFKRVFKGKGAPSAYHRGRCATFREYSNLANQRSTTGANNETPPAEARGALVCSLPLPMSDADFTVTTLLSKVSYPNNSVALPVCSAKNEIEQVFVLI